ncbi:hypothetical protein Tsubulata_015286, partial [Turnera subulata]
KNMAGIGSLVDLLLFYTLERVLFNRMVCSIGLNPALVKKAIALWLALEQLGYPGLIRTISSYDNSSVEALFYKALQGIHCMHPDAVQPRESDVNPVSVALFDEPMNPVFIHRNRELMYSLYGHVMDTVCDKIFGETMALEVDESGSKPVIRRQGEESSQQGLAIYVPEAGTFSELGGQASEQSRLSNLNPDATGFYPEHTREESRKMFLTFSKGHPLSSEEIVSFFTSNWGQVVESVSVEPTQHGKDPKFARILFTNSLVIPRVLNGQAKAKFMVNGKHLWARSYVCRQGGNSLI